MTKTLVDVDDELLADVMAQSGARTKKQAINEALEYYREAQRTGPQTAWKNLRRMAADGTLNLDEVERLSNAHKDDRSSE
ncbi:type II toxin-antitoxin system VapB family antitoxin [Glycomyces sp. MUSA5-2]|uniref:type II toxin-antitoxin system VapB family antitoxin n=1 Tax=Glycomyces sp. MUSA5-2 TaxID=2053002 RepID=UPI0030084E11